MTRQLPNLDPNQTLALVCGLTLVGGLCIGAAWTSWLVRRVPRVVTDDTQQEYRDAALIDWSTSVWAELDREAS